MEIATDENKVKTPRKPRPVKHGHHTEETEFQRVANLPVFVPAFGRRYEIKRFSIMQIAQALTYSGPLQFAVQQLADKGQGLTKGEIASVILAALSISGESIIGLVSVATSEPIEWIQEQDDPIAAMEILTAVVEKNSDFFFAGEHRKGQGSHGQTSKRDPGALWSYINFLVGAGHDYLTILHHYTWDHVLNFLAETDLTERRRYKEAIFANRTAQLDKKHFNDALRKLDQQERQIRILRRRHFVAEGHTEEEAIWLAHNSSEKRLSDLSKREQAKLKKEMNQMFASIPEEFRERARELSGM